MSTATKTKVTIKKRKSLKKECEDLWFELIKLRADYKSELSGRTNDLEPVAGHHIAGKSNYRLRFEPRNGICISYQTEHEYGVHNSDPSISRKYQDLIIKKIGYNTWEWLLSLKSCKEKQDLTLIKLYLKQEIEKIKNGTIHNKM